MLNLHPSPSFAANILDIGADQGTGNWLGLVLTKILFTNNYFDKRWQAPPVPLTNHLGSPICCIRTRSTGSPYERYTAILHYTLFQAKVFGRHRSQPGLNSLVCKLDDYQIVRKCDVVSG